MWKKIFYFFLKKEVQTLTYFIPAPPARQNGYRETEFDRLLHNFLNSSAFSLVELKTISHPHGFWCLAILKGPRRKNSQLLELQAQEQDSEVTWSLDDSLNHPLSSEILVKEKNDKDS